MVSSGPGKGIREHDTPTWATFFALVYAVYLELPAEDTVSFHSFHRRWFGRVQGFTVPLKWSEAMVAIIWSISFMHTIAIHRVAAYG